jgi:hypothetical protein
MEGSTYVMVRKRLLVVSWVAWNSTKQTRRAIAAINHQSRANAYNEASVEGPVLLAKKTKGKNEIFIARTPW